MFVLYAWGSTIYPPSKIWRSIVFVCFSIISGLCFCSCGSEDSPSFHDDFSTSSEEDFIHFLPNSSWHLRDVIYNVGDVSINAAWKDMRVVFSSDSAYFWRKDIVFDPISHQNTPTSTLAKSCSFCVKDGKIVLENEIFEPKMSSGNAIFTLISPDCTLQLAYEKGGNWEKSNELGIES